MKKVVLFGALVSMSVVQAFAPKTFVAGLVIGAGIARSADVRKFVDANKQTIQNGIEQLPQQVQTVIKNGQYRVQAVKEHVHNKIEDGREWILECLESDEETAARHELFGIKKFDEGTVVSPVAQKRVEVLREQGIPVAQEATSAVDKATQTEPSAPQVAATEPENFN